MVSVLHPTCEPDLDDILNQVSIHCFVCDNKKLICIIIICIIFYYAA